MLLCGGMDRIIQGVCIDLAKKECRVEKANNTGEIITSMAFTLDKKTLIVGTFDGKCLFIDMNVCLALPCVSLFIA